MCSHTQYNRAVTQTHTPLPRFSSKKPNLFNGLIPSHLRSVTLNSLLLSRQCHLMYLKLERCKASEANQLMQNSQWFSNLSEYQNYLESLLKHRWLAPSPSLSHLVSLEGSLRTCISNMLPGDGDAKPTGLGNTHWEPPVQRTMRIKALSQTWPHFNSKHLRQTKMQVCHTLRK